MDNLGLVLKKKPKAIDLPKLNSSIDVWGEAAYDNLVSQYEQYIGQELTDIFVIAHNYTAHSEQIRLQICKVENIDVTVFDTDVVDDNGKVYDYLELYLYVRCPMGNQYMVNGALIYFYKEKKQMKISTSNMFDISTAHSPSGLLLPEMGGMRFEEHEYGFIVFVTEPEESPHWIREIMQEAVKQKCILINFDADGEIVDGLPTYSHS
jgi:hypothetical protein